MQFKPIVLIYYVLIHLECKLILVALHQDEVLDLVSHVADITVCVA